MTRSQGIWYYCVHVLLVCAALGLTTTSAVVAFRPEFRVRVRLSVVLLGAGVVAEGLYEFSSERARKGAVWILYSYFTTPLLLVAANILDRAGRPDPSGRDRIARNGELALFGALIVLTSLARLLFLTWGGFCDFLHFEVRTQRPTRAPRHWCLCALSSLAPHNSAHARSMRCTISQSSQVARKLTRCCVRTSQRSPESIT